MNLTIEGESLVDIEEKIIGLARDIEERRTLLSQGCTCNLRVPAATQVYGNVDGVFAHRGPARCTEAFAVCKSRQARWVRDGRVTSTGMPVVDAPAS